MGAFAGPQSGNRPGKQPALAHASSNGALSSGEHLTSPSVKDRPEALETGTTTARPSHSPNYRHRHWRTTLPHRPPTREKTLEPCALKPTGGHACRSSHQSTYWPGMMNGHHRIVTYSLKPHSNTLSCPLHTGKPPIQAIQAIDSMHVADPTGIQSATEPIA